MIEGLDRPDAERTVMAFPWKTFGKYALQFAEYALAQKMAPQQPTPPPMPVSAPPQVPLVVTNPQAVEPTGLQPAPDLVSKWRGTLDAMAMQILGHRMAEDELFNNAKLLEAGDVAGVEKNLRGKL